MLEFRESRAQYRPSFPERPEGPSIVQSPEDLKRPRGHPSRGKSLVDNPRYNYLTLTLSDAEFKRLVEWMEQQDPKPTRAQAARILLLAGLERAV